MDDKKLGVFICSGCEIGNSLDIDALKEAAEDASTFVHPCLCGEEGLQQIRQELENGIDAIVIAGCSPRFKTEEFRFDDKVVERVSLREQVIWTHPPNDEDTQMMAADAIRMGVARAARVAANDPATSESDPTILVVGGGLAGLTAAREASRAGHPVVLVEKEEKLGGRRHSFHTVFPSQPPFDRFESGSLDGIISELQASDSVRVLTSATVGAISGQPGSFDVEVRRNGDSAEFRVGAVIQATGWRPYDAHNLPHLGYGKSDNVVTNVQMEDLLAKGVVQKPSDGSTPRRIAFVQCAGSRDSEHLPYCSAVCCRVSLKQALELRRANPDLEVYILYKDIRTPGQYEDLYRKAQSDPGIFFTKAEVESVEPTSDGSLRLEASQTLLGERIALEADMVVLATGMVPVAADGEAIRKVRDARKVIEKGETGARMEAAKKVVEELGESVGESILNLNYRQGPDTPHLRHGFPDSHFICFPYETRRTGIYMTGCMRAPADSESVRVDAAGAVLKAIQAIQLTGEGKALHPRWEDMSFPNFSLQRCTQCKRCTEECPFGALNEDEKGTPKPNPARCRRCGICMGACPERVVSFSDYSIDIVSSMIRAVEIPDEFEEKPRLLCLLCENDAYPALDTAGMKRLQYSSYVRFIPVRCLGSVNTVWIADALSRGFDGILLLGCKSGDDYQCHFIRGSELMGTRGKNIREKLTQLALEEERVRLEEISITEYDRLPEIINEFAEQIEEVGLNPFKGF
ncbi:MAG: FAD-dependent oxidoreductase [Acidobacteriota bacterium]